MTEIHPTLDGLKVAVSRLRSYGGNPRRGDVEAIRESLRVHGQYRPLVVNRPTMEVLAGNHTLAAAKELGWAQVAVTYVEVDGEQAKRIVLVDNRSNDLAGYDVEALCELLGELPDFDGTGYDQGALDALLEELEPPELEEGELPALPEQPSSVPGDLYRLGEHRLLCGDARDAGGVARLMDGGAAQLLWTDPPYGVDYVGKTAKRLRLAGDSPHGLEALLGEAFAAADGVLAAGAGLYVAHPAGPLSVLFGRCFLEAGWQLRQTLVWVKDCLVLGRCDYHYRHEPILYGYKPGAGRRGRGAAGWYGGHAQSSVIEVARPRASREHPTSKPVELIALALGNSTRRGDLVLDPFGGSGSTLMAAERLGRGARVVELDPRYCDVIVARWEHASGRPAIREPAR